MEVPKVRLYVKSLEKPVGTENVVADVPVTIIVKNVVRVFPTHDVKTVTKYEYELPEEQEHLIEIVKEVAAKVGLKLEIIDAGKMDLFDEPLPKEVKQLKNFPVLATESKTQLATGFTREDIERFLSNK
jgi:hypothetical protein